MTMFVILARDHLIATVFDEQFGPSFELTFIDAGAIFSEQAFDTKIVPL
jgi:hypothetical protein